MILYPADMGRGGGADRVRVPGVNLEIYELVPNLFYLRDQCLDVDSRREDIRAPQIAKNAVQLGHLNRARPSAWDWRELYDAATRSLVGECWAEEIEELGYVFED